MSALAARLPARLKRLIAAAGPISIAQYMALANAHYYATRDPLGVVGDFTTAPEVSQMFGEMIGVWLADRWRRAGAPAVRFVELGPGRGTLARDCLAVLAKFGCAPSVHLVETSPVLRAAQASALPPTPGAQWHDSLDEVPRDAPMLLITNEFLDALPVRQLVMTHAGWRERLVGIAEGRFVPVAGAQPMDAAVPKGLRAAQPGAILETSPAVSAVMHEIGAHLAAAGGAALIIDYGYAGGARPGSTLQAVRRHARADPFAAPGEADLTAHVDFAAARASAEAAGACWIETTPQGAWLAGVGIAARAAALTRAAPARGAEIAQALHRLIDPAQMGALFKVMALASGVDLKSA